MKTLIAAIIAIESGGDNRAIGDRDLPEKAYGCLQIRQPVCDDYNRANGTDYRAEQCLGNRELSVKIFRWYVGYYATKERLGRKPTDQDRARIWNGGPDGWKRKSTLAYWKKVRDEMKERGKGRTKVLRTK